MGQWPCVVSGLLLVNSDIDTHRTSSGGIWRPEQTSVASREIRHSPLAGMGSVPQPSPPPLATFYEQCAAIEALFRY